MVLVKNKFTKFERGETREMFKVRWTVSTYAKVKCKSYTYRHSIYHVALQPVPCVPCHISCYRPPYIAKSIQPDNQGLRDLLRDIEEKDDHAKDSGVLLDSYL